MVLPQRGLLFAGLSHWDGDHGEMVGMVGMGATIYPLVNIQKAIEHGHL